MLRAWSSVARLGRRSIGASLQGSVCVQAIDLFLRIVLQQLLECGI